MANRYFQLPPPDAQIDWTHPITRGLQIGFTANHITANTYGGSGIVRSNNGTLRGTTTGVKLANYHEANGTNGSINAGAVRTGDVSTVVMSMQWDGGYSQIYDNSQSSAYIAYSGIWSFHLYRYTGTHRPMAGFAIPAGFDSEWHIYGFYHPNSNLYTDFECYADGVPLAITSTDTGVGATAANGNVYNHYVMAQNASTLVTDGRLKFYYHWKRKLSPAEHRLLANDPYCFWTWQGKKNPIQNIEDLQQQITGAATPSFAITTTGTPLRIFNGSISSNIVFTSSFQTVEFGVATSNIAFTTSALGGFPLSGAATSSIAITTSSNSFKTANATSLVYLSVDTTINGKATRSAEASVNIPFTTTSDSFRTTYGASSTAFAITTSTNGSLTANGGATPSFAITTTNDGLITRQSSASPSVSVNSTSDALKTLYGASSKTVQFSAVINGKLFVGGATAELVEGVDTIGGTSNITFSTSASGFKTIYGDSSAQVAIAALATITGSILGQANAQVAITTNGTALKTLFAASSPNINITTNANGTKILLGGMEASCTLTSQSSALLTFQGATSAQINVAASLLVSTGFVISFIDEFTMELQWDKTLKASINPIEAFNMPIEPTSIKGR